MLNGRSILRLAYAHDDDIRTPGAGVAGEQGAGHSRAASFPADPPAANAWCGIGRRVRAGMRLAFTAAISVSQSAIPGFARVME